MWRIEFDERAFKDLERLSKTDRQRVRRFIDHRVLVHNNPRTFGIALTGELKGLWRYRVGDIRIVARIEDNRFIVMVLSIGQRDKVYKR